MKIVDFVNLTEDAREHAIFEYAIPVSTDFRNTNLHILYQLNYFFVEKVIEVSENKVVEINCFDASSSLLDFYLNEIVLPAF